MQAELVAEATFPPRSSVSRLPGHGWLIHSPLPGLVVVDERLVALARFPLPSAWTATHAVTPDLSCAAISERDRVLLIDGRGKVVWQVHHRPWGDGDSESGSCAFANDGARIWATVPTTDGPDEWWMLDRATGRKLGAAPLECYAAGSFALLHPDGEHIGLSVGDGQDGAEVYWGRWDGCRPAVSRLDDSSRGLVDVHPDGRHYLTPPHASDGDLALHAFPSGRVVAQRVAAEALPPDDWFDFQAGFVDENTVLAGSAQEGVHVLLAARSLEPIARVDYPADAAKESIMPTHRGTWLTNEYATGLHQVWRLAKGA